jgi:hypothetical protein
MNAIFEEEKYRFSIRNNIALMQIKIVDPY